MMKTLKITLIVSALALVSSLANAANLKAGSCRGISTPNGFKYVGTYCEDYACTVTSVRMFNGYCPYSD